MSNKLKIIWTKAPPKHLDVPLEVKTFNVHWYSDDDVEVTTIFHYKDIKAKTILGQFGSCRRTVRGNPADVFNNMYKGLNAEKENFYNKWIRSKALFNRKTPFQRAGNEPFLNMVNNFGMTPKRFADATGVENSVLFRELKGQRKLSLDKAINYAKALACDPVDLLFEKQMCKLWGSVDLFNSHDYGNETAYIGQIKPVRQLEEGKQDPSKGLLADQLIQVPRDIYRPEIKAILIDSLGSHLHNHFVYYYYTDNSIAVENKLVVVGKEIPELEEIGMDTTQYFFGILQIQKGKQILINPEPTSDQKQITVGPFSFIAPVVATVKRGSMRKDHDYHQSISYAEDIKEAEEKILATQEKVQAELKKQLERMEYDIKKLNELSEKEKEKLKDTFEKKKLYKSLEDIPAFIRKKIG